MPSVQKQLERELTPEHPLHGKQGIAIARRLDCDDVLVRLGDGAYDAFVSAMQKDFDEYGEHS